MEKHNSDDKQKTEKLPTIESDQNWNVEKLLTLGWKIGTDELWCFSNVSLHTLTHVTRDLGIWFNLKLVLYLEVLANQKNNANLGPNRV